MNSSRNSPSHPKKYDLSQLVDRVERVRSLGLEDRVLEPVLSMLHEVTATTASLL